jgi:hypothetical protein
LRNDISEMSVSPPDLVSANYLCVEAKAGTNKLSMHSRSSGKNIQRTKSSNSLKTLETKQHKDIEQPFDQIY